MRKGSKEMRLKIFTITFIVMLMILTGSSFLVYTQLMTIKGINLGLLEDKLYEESTEILSWSLKNIDKALLKDNPLPKSWAEIMLVDNNNLSVISSTNKAHAGNSMYKVPELLDQAPVGDAVARLLDQRAQAQAVQHLLGVGPRERNLELGARGAVG